MPISRCGTEKGQPVGAGAPHQLGGIFGVDALCEHFFRASGAVGMGTTAQPPAAAATSGNPYLSRNLTAIVQLETENPELASQLKAEAARAR